MHTHWLTSLVDGCYTLGWQCPSASIEIAHFGYYTYWMGVKLLLAFIFWPLNIYVYGYDFCHSDSALPYTCRSTILSVDKYYYSNVCGL